MAEHDYDRMAEADSEALSGVLTRSFYFRDDFWEKWTGLHGLEKFRVVRREGRVVGGLGIMDYGQWFGGRLVPMGGISAVGVAPDERGTGAAAALMAGTLRELRELGIPISALWASTQRLYRKVGYEHAGTICDFSIPADAIGLADRDLPIRESSLDEWEELQPIRREFGRQQHGFMERDESYWKGFAVYPPPDRRQIVIVAGDSEGYAYLIQSRAKGGYDFYLQDFVALTAAARRRLWTWIADARSLARNVGFDGPPRLPDLLLFPEQKWETKDLDRWMLRITDVPAALTARGYPEGIEGTVHLEIEDDVIPENDGRFVLRVADGRAEAEPGGDGALRLHVRDLAPIYSGLYSATALRALGRVDGDDASTAAADLVFGAPEPWMADHF